jgi:hypothetical protein
MHADRVPIVGAWANVESSVPFIRLKHDVVAAGGTGDC